MQGPQSADCDVINFKRYWTSANVIVIYPLGTMKVFSEYGVNPFGTC